MSSDTQTGELAMRAQALTQRLHEIEDALSVQEWWLLGRELPEARLLSEISSLMAVARAELETVLTQVFGTAVPYGDSADHAPDGPADANAPHDDTWHAQRREQALGLLRTIALALPPMLQYAQMLRQYAERFGLPSAAIDGFGIVSDRLNEIGEALREPPR